MIGRENRSTRRKPAPMPLCPPQTPHAARTRTWAAAVGSQRLTAWGTAWPLLCVWRFSPSVWTSKHSFSRELSNPPPRSSTLVNQAEKCRNTSRCFCFRVMPRFLNWGRRIAKLLEDVRWLYRSTFEKKTRSIGL
jgi:hypothetical protein